jgi:CarD family transcriptional regulator
MMQTYPLRTVSPAAGSVSSRVRRGATIVLAATTGSKSTRAAKTKAPAKPGSASAASKRAAATKTRAATTASGEQPAKSKKKATATTKKAPARASAKPAGAAVAAPDRAAAVAVVQAPAGRAAGGVAAPAADTSPQKRKQSRALKYKVGQQLVYPLQGVGNVQRIEERDFRDETLLYYIVYLEVSDMTVMVPVDKTEELGIRAIVSRGEANKALKLITEEDEPIPTDWKLRYQMNLDLLKKGAVTDIATVVRALYHRSKIKELPILERKLYDNALKLLVDEVSFSLGKEKDFVEAMIFERLDAAIALAAAK